MFDLYYRNPRLLVLTLVLILVAGISAWKALPRREDPEILSRTALVFTAYPGATAERVETLVTEKIEDELREIEEIREIKSNSRAGISIIQINLKDAVTDADEVWGRTRDKIDDAVPRMPPEVLDPDFEEFTIDAYTMIAAIVWELPTPPNHAILRRLAEELEDEFRAVSGTKDTELFGENPEEIVIEIDAEELAARGLTPADAARAIHGSDAKVAAGRLRSAKNDLLIEVAGEIKTLDQLRRIPIRFGEGAQVVRLGDIAAIRKTIAEPPRSLALMDGRVSVTVAARMEASMRVDEWAGAARARLADFEGRLPDGVGLETVFDQSRYTEVRLAGLLQNLGLGALLVFVVILFMMGWRSAILVGSALPLASLMVLTGMNLLGVPLHQMSISGLIVALGLLIDSAIVVVDEVRHRVQGATSARVAVAGAVKTLAVPLVASTLTTALAFMPLLMGAGPVGEFVGPMSLSVVLAISSSLFLALTVIPALTGLLDRVETKSTWWRTGFSSARLLALYRASLGYLFRRPAVAVGLALLLPIFGFSKAMELEQQFFPPADRDQFPIELRMPAHSSMEETRRYAMEARDLLLRHDRVSNVHWFLGGSAPKFYYNMIEGESGTSSYGQALVQLDTAEGAGEVIRTLQAWLDDALPAAQFMVKQIEQGPPFDAPIEIFLHGPELSRLQEIGERLRAELAQVEGVTHTRATLARGRPKLWLKTDEESANLAGFDRRSIAAQLDAHLEGAVGGSMLEDTEELPVRVRLKSTSRGDLSRIASLELVAPDGTWTPVSALGELELEPVLADLPHRNGRRVNTIQGFTHAGELPEATFNEFWKRAEPILAALPPSYSYEFGGEKSERERAQATLFSSAGVLLVLMLATLVLSFNSFRLAAALGFVAFLCVGLSMGALWTFGYPFGFMAIIGTMGLLGVAINDAIVVLAAIRADDRAAAGDAGAVQEVVLRSTRHIFSTTVTTIAGFLPLILAGGGFWPPLAIAIAGGVTGATILALYFVPAVYVLMSRKRAAATVAVTAQPVGSVA